jgi:preprotein translocase subunit SecG
MNTVNIVEIIWCVAAFCLTAMVLLHSPKGDGIGGIGGQAQLFASTKSAESNLNRITWGLFLVFITLTIVLSAGWLTNGAVPVPVTVPPVGN